MEQRDRLLMLSLLALSCMCIHCKNIVYYVRPIFPLDVDCPGDPCHYLNYYGTKVLEPPDTNTVTMILMEGYHRAAQNNVYNFGCPVNSHTLRIIGDRQNSDTVEVDEMTTRITIKNTILEGFTAFNVYLFIDKSVVDSQTINISVSNCAFVESTMILAHVHLTIKDSNFSMSTSTAVMLFSSTLTIVGYVRFHDNRGFQGGALMLVGTVMQIANDAKLLFQDNHAKKTGGAINVVHSQMIINAYNFYSSCFYQLLDYTNDSTYNIEFINNSAASGGDHIYGASLESGCTCAHIDDIHTVDSIEVFHQFFSFDPGYKSSFSAVSADATRVCVCDADGKPQCDITKDSLIAYPGGKFSLYVVVVGGDYGTTTGTVYASFLHEFKNSTPSLGSSNQQYQVITKNSECSMLNFSVYSNKSSEILFLIVQDTHIESVEDYYYYDDYDIGLRCILFNLFDGNHTENINFECDFINTDIKSRFAPIFFDIDLLPCPLGFVLLGDPPHCQCHPVLTASGVNCILNHLNGYHMWNSANIWIQAVDSNENNTMILLGKHCPFGYCKPSRKRINLTSPDTQCALNRAGILCGGCKKNYSLAIGSSHCIHCPTNNNIALLIFFAVAGVILVLIVAALNLTVTQGMINSLVFYANIVWAYQDILVPSGFGKELIVHKTFIAWLNLDFGIETCFFHGMNAYTKTWLQFVFPLYTASLFLLGLHFSSKLSTLFGSRSVPTLATLLYLSYAKLLRNTIACLQLVAYYNYNDSNIDGSINAVWAIDGNYSFGRYPHVFLLLAAIACFILLWIPYTLLLFSMQWLRSVDHYGPLKFIAQYKPLYDAYFAPLKDKHHYWFGLLLLVQGVLLLVSSLTLYTLPEVSVFLLLTISIFLLCYVNGVRPYKRMLVALLETSFMINFIILAVGYLYFRDNNKGRAILLSLSITAAIIEFCGIVIWNLIPKKLIERFQIKSRRLNVELDLEDVHILEEHHAASEYVGYHDSQNIKCDKLDTCNAA